MAASSTVDTTHARIRKAMAELGSEGTDPSHRLRRAKTAIMASKPEHLPHMAAGILSDLQRAVGAERCDEPSRSEYLAILSQLRAVEALIEYHKQRNRPKPR